MTRRRPLNSDETVLYETKMSKDVRTLSKVCLISEPLLDVVNIIS